MTTQTPSKKNGAPPPDVDPLLRKPIPHAYALVPHPEKEGMFYAVHLTNVSAEALEHLEYSARPAPATYGMLRIEGAMQRRHHEKKWGKT